MKKAIKVLAVLLAVCFCSSALAMAADTAAADVPEQGTFVFGMYPQSNVKDRALVEKLDKIRESDDSDVIKLNGQSYLSYRVEKPSNPGGGPFGATYGYYPYDEEHGRPTYWFTYEPIAWRVLDSNADGVLLISEKVLCTHTFNDAIRADNTWENSDVRKWLNGTFMRTAFTAKEQAFVLTTALTNEPNPVHGTYNGVPSPFAGNTSGGYPFVGTPSGGSTTDKIFLPSFNEITNADYGFNVGWKDKKGDFNQPVGYYETDILPGEHSARSTSATDYAKCQGAWANLTVGEDGVYTIEDKGIAYSIAVPTCRYWLRTAGYDANCAAGVLEDGRVSTGWDVSYDIVGIRPMMRVSPDAVADGTVADTQDVNLPFHITASSESFRYNQKDVKLVADTDVTWESSDPRIAEIDAETGEVTIHRVGTATITATSKETGETVEFKMEISYTWWQQLIRIFLFGWLWMR